MSVQRFSADTIAGPSTSNGYQQHASQSGQVYHRRDVNDFNSMSSSMTETNALMNNCQQHHQGRHMEIGTPDANNASSMSSNNNNFHDYNNATSQAAAHPQYNTTSAQDLFIQFHEALALEPKYQPNLFLPQQSNTPIMLDRETLDFVDNNGQLEFKFVSLQKTVDILFSLRNPSKLTDGEITIGTRDGAAHVLRCLKVWYELSNDVLFTAINHVDRFLTKMKVRPKHMACISVGSLHLAIKQLGVEAIDTEDLVAISQCRCTARDLERMAEIIQNKLGVQMCSPPTSGLTFIRLFYHIFRLTAIELGLQDFYDSSIVLSDLEQRMEILACDANCASIRPSELALVAICTLLDAASISKLEAGSNQIHGLVDYAIQLQKLCRIPDTSFFHTHDLVVKILSNYNGQQKMPYRQRLVWKLSSRTLRTLRPTDKLKVSSYLPTIEEDNNNLRYRTGSVSSEDGSEEDWPTSPVVAVCEQC